ncbi:MAG: DUF4908 domain-containing protein [Alphaproteobacteria bacterium]|nr:DUF4908 domain-containing protein [Alphaproteobacteria bacterium]
MRVHVGHRFSRIGVFGVLALFGAGVGEASAQQAARPQSSSPSSSPRSDASALSLSALRRAVNPGAAKYEDTVSQRSFVLDRSGDEPLIKFEDSPEVYALRSTTAQRGDAFLRSDAGDLILRVTELGNVISYLGNKDGAPADIAGAAAPLDAPAMPASLTDRVKEAAAHLSEMVGRDVTIFGAGAFSRQEAWASDALMVAVLGMERAVKVSPTDARRLTAVRLLRASQPRAVFSEGELVLELNPQEGYAGRPSSEAIAEAMTVSRRGR